MTTTAAPATLEHTFSPVLDRAHIPPEPASTPPPPASSTRRLELTVAGEPRVRRILFLLLAVVFALGYFHCTQAYWAPAHPGVDQNGYLVGGRQFAATLSTGIKPLNPFQYFGAMWIMTEDGWMYPKYPLGIPILTAICFWLGGTANGPALTYLVSPICAALSLVAIFLLTRAIAGSFAAMLSVLLLATNPIFLTQTNNPWSHVPDLAFVLWGMTFLLWWWRYDGLWRAAVAGLLLGYAMLIRYTEGLLLLPMAVVCLSKLQWRQPRSYLTCAVPLLAWLIPVGYLLAFNQLAMGTWTGYDTTNESTGFDASTFAERWRTMFDLLYSTGAFFILPLGMLGLLLMFRWRWQLALFLVAWLVPGVIVYTSYYWAGMGGGGMGYLRFFLTLIPPLIIGACWLLHVLTSEDAPFAAGRSEADRPAPRHPAPVGRVVPVIAAGLLIALCSSVTVRNSLAMLERDFATNTNLATTGRIIDLYTKNTPPSDVVLFAESGGVASLANYLQFVTGFELYAADAFSGAPPRWNRRPAGNEDQPDPFQPRRREAIRAVYETLSDADLVKKQNEIMDRALAQGRRVLAVMPATAADAFTRRYLQDRPYEVRTLTTWREPVRQSEIQTLRPDARGDRRRGQGPPAGPPPGVAPGGIGQGGFAGGGFAGPAPAPRDMRLIEILRK